MSRYARGLKPGLDDEGGCHDAFERRTNRVTALGYSNEPRRMAGSGGVREL
ncbi:hypothetical protein [Nitrococcus mobilis]|uniref:hypothetical protein n=1 Tax=Nitrococcus mobilis TaxID=35797 RepID=UPI001E2C14F5|nr:hypothetical protein [Nitrococcus mobilis]